MDRVLLHGRPMVVHQRTKNEAINYGHSARQQHTNAKAQ